MNQKDLPLSLYRFCRRRNKLRARKELLKISIVHSKDFLGRLACVKGFSQPGASRLRDLHNSFNLVRQICGLCSPMNQIDRQELSKTEP
jgi:hypothetical protein